jgi:hypothetical protein
MIQVEYDLYITPDDVGQEQAGKRRLPNVDGLVLL